MQRRSETMGNFSFHSWEQKQVLVWFLVSIPLMEQKCVQQGVAARNVDTSTSCKEGTNMPRSFSLVPEYQQSHELAEAMKALSSPESTRKKSRRVCKPLMEKRRRERINSSLETLRLLMLENTRNEKLRNPKVEKAEILESVVEFLKAEKEVEKGHQAAGKILPKEQRQTCPVQHSYRDGMRSCLLRVSQFIATKSQELEQAGDGTVKASFALAEPKMLPTSAGHVHRSLMAAPAGDSAALSPQHHISEQPVVHGNTKLLSTSAASTHIVDPVWRPWPQ